MNKNQSEESSYWTKRYAENRTGWDIGYAATPFKNYIDQLTDKSIKILIPGAGNAYEAEYLFQNGFYNVYVLDISQTPLDSFLERVSNFPKSQLLLGDFFTLSGDYDLILEQTFFCSFVPTPENRFAYVKQMANLLTTNGKLVGLWFDIPLTGDMEKRPFGGDKQLYLSYLETNFNTVTFEKCYNSIPERLGNEFFGIFLKK
ncbi:methyltransferase domain-containing protein [Aquimarina sp. AD10]|uniref:methyltransferase domain-containing protein n=1 Tax=Aquimarina sp. AD10 TaxID=1714849 RepID=UPI000E4D945A|nr:methyltransferase domain-containing protein [Aquimarina sp. AD10]AXT62791.1 methyltransferase domain-containing protein [Aquimarina sp. AD10]RKN01975.1 methyltransferase domain-containing protein [Aquimarina sp. AD10]